MLINQNGFVTFTATFKDAIGDLYGFAGHVSDHTRMHVLIPEENIDFAPGDIPEEIVPEIPDMSEVTDVTGLAKTPSPVIHVRLFQPRPESVDVPAEDVVSTTCEVDEDDDAVSVETVIRTETPTEADVTEETEMEIEAEEELPVADPIANLKAAAERRSRFGGALSLQQGGRDVFLIGGLDGSFPTEELKILCERYSISFCSFPLNIFN